MGWICLALLLAWEARLSCEARRSVAVSVVASSLPQAHRCSIDTFLETFYRLRLGLRLKRIVASLNAPNERQCNRRAVKALHHYEGERLLERLLSKYLFASAVTTTQVEIASRLISHQNYLEFGNFTKNISLIPLPGFFPHQKSLHLVDMPEATARLAP